MQPFPERSEGFGGTPFTDRCGRDKSRPVEGSGERVQFHADSRLQQPKGVFDSFVAERVEFHGGEVGRRQTCEVGGPGRCSVNRNVRIFGA